LKKGTVPFLADSDGGLIVTTSGHSGPQSGPRDRYDRASLIAKIHAALANV